jgi:hypothetical protein
MADLFVNHLYGPAAPRQGEGEPENGVVVHSADVRLVTMGIPSNQREASIAAQPESLRKQAAQEWDRIEALRVTKRAEAAQEKALETLGLKGMTKEQIAVLLAAQAGK